MQFPISDGAAVVFARALYAAIAFGCPIDAALAEACKAILAADNDIEWGTPVLYLRAEGARLFALAPAGDETRGAPAADRAGAIGCK